MKNVNEMTIEQLISYYNITLHADRQHIYVRPYVKVTEDDRMLIRNKKPEILAYLINKRDAEEKAYEIRQQKIAAIEGIKEITDALDDLAAWQREFEKSFEDVGGFGVRAKPSVDIAALKAKYPVAVAYLTAEQTSNMRNYEMSACGREALDAIIDNPDDYENIIKAMNDKIKAYCDEHIWD